MCGVQHVQMMVMATMDDVFISLHNLPPPLLYCNTHSPPLPTYTPHPHTHIPTHTPHPPHPLHFRCSSGDHVSLHCLDRHPHQPHLVALGRSDGSVGFWDLRQEAHHLQLIQAHGSNGTTPGVQTWVAVSRLPPGLVDPFLKTCRILIEP